MNEERAEKIARAIVLTYKSLYSHLSYTYGKELSSKYIRGLGGKAYHKGAVKMYAEVIKILSELY